MRGRKLISLLVTLPTKSLIKKESPNEGTETLSCMKVTDSDGISDKKESPNEGTEKVRLEFSRALMNQFRDLHADCI